MFHSRSIQRVSLLLCVNSSLSFRLTPDEEKKGSSPPLSPQTLQLAADLDAKEQKEAEHGYGGAARASGPAVAAVEDSISSRLEGVTREDMLLKQVKQGDRVADFKAQHKLTGVSVYGQ
jgi:hypothetical protein